MTQGRPTEWVNLALLQVEPISVCDQAAIPKTFQHVYLLIKLKSGKCTATARTLHTQIVVAPVSSKISGDSSEMRRSLQATFASKMPHLYILDAWLKKGFSKSHCVQTQKDFKHCMPAFQLAAAAPSEPKD